MGERKSRLDALLVARNLAETRERAKRLILAGHVQVNGQVLDKPGMRVAVNAPIQVKQALRYVSRGGLKLEAALADFSMNPEGAVAADFGASTGGFTDCLLQHGAALVYAVDVGYGQLAWRLRCDPRVTVLDRTNVRHLEALPEPVDLVTIDVSFISLALVLPAARRVLKPGAGEVVALVKPQFEAGRDNVGRGGVVRDPAIHRAVLENVYDMTQAEGFTVRGLTRSPITGPAGNVEFLLHLALRGEAVDWPAAVNRVLEAEGARGTQP